jgi:CTP:molybdopterin cytidylyltransferase MocA
MTVAAVVLVPEPQAALAPADGEPALRRLAQTAWSGGASADGGRRVRGPTNCCGRRRRSLGHADQPGPDEPHGIAWFVRGMRTAVATVAETSAALLWPFRFVWVDPETVTSLVEAHGATPEAIIRPAYGGRPGFPILMPVALSSGWRRCRGSGGEEAVESLVEPAGVPMRQIELGRPGDRPRHGDRRGRSAAYQGPPEPAGGPPPDWNSVLAAQAADQPR